MSKRVLDTSSTDETVPVGGAVPVVDVLIPTMGRDRYLVEAVESVLAQTHPSWRLVICFDGPPEAASESMLERYLFDPRVTVRATDGKVGAAANITGLLAGARGDYMMVLHDDDRLRPGALAAKVEFMERHPECGMVFGPHLDIDGQGCVRAEQPLPYSPGMLDRGEVVHDFALSNPIATMHAALMRRDTLAGCGAYVDAAFPRLYDWELWMRLICAAPVGYVDSFDAEYRVHGRQVSAGKRDALEFLALFEHGDRLADAGGCGPRLSPHEHDRRLSQLQLAVALDKAEQGHKREALASLRDAVRLSPAALLRPRLLVGLAGIVMGRPGARLLRAGRLATHGRHWRRYSTRQAL